MLASREAVSGMGNAESWKDFINRFSDLDKHNMIAIGEIIIDKLSGASDEVLERFKLTMSDMKTNADKINSDQLDVIYKLRKRVGVLEDRMGNKNKKIASLKYQNKKKDGQLKDMVIKSIDNDNHTVINIGKYRIIKENK
jgi:hypothetical protein